MDFVVTGDGKIIINDDLRIPENQDVTLEHVEKITGSVVVREGATFTAPALTKSGYVDVRQGATFTAPALKDADEVRLEGEFLGEDITVIDGIGCVVLSCKD